MGGNGTIICESVISYRDVADWKYIPLPCVVIGVTDPVAKEIEDCIEFYKYKELLVMVDNESRVALKSQEKK